MSMIRPHWNRPSGSLHEGNYLSHYRGHIRIAFEVIRFVKITGGITLRTSQVQEMYVVSESDDHFSQVIVRSCTI
jgi:hypothetical protein